MENPPPLALPPLPEEILIEILSKLPVKSLLRFRCVSKSWKLLISTSYKKLPPPMSGLFYRNTSKRKIEFASLPSTSYVESVPVDTGLTFLPPNLLPNLNIADCRNGLLLLATSRFSTIYICNPATSKWAHIPEPPSDPHQLLLAFDPCRSKHYHVISVPYLDLGAEDDGDELEVFSSLTCRWAAINRFSGPIDDGILSFGGFLSGILYYVDPITGDTLAIDIEGRVCWRVKGPVVSPWRIAQHCFGQSGGILHLATDVGDEMLVWVLEDSSSNECVLKNRNTFEAVVGGRFGGCLSPNGMAFHSDLDILFLTQQRELLAYHLISGNVEKICNLQDGGPVFPYSPCLSEDLKL